MKNLSLVTLGVALSALLVSSVTLQAGVAGSPHDFSGESWNVQPSDPASVCGPCHQAHHADSSIVPLWGHKTTSSTFRMYNTANVPVSEMDAVPSPQPTGASLGCLSCHDGTVAVNNYGGQTWGSPWILTNNASLGTDLTHSHPISFDYTPGLVGTGANQDQWLQNPDTTDVLVPSSGTFIAPNSLKINDFLLGGNHRMECSSCHDVHNQEGTPFNITTNPKLLKINGTQGGKGSLLCRSCHIK